MDAYLRKNCNIDGLFSHQLHLIRNFFRHFIMTPPERKRGKSKALLGKTNLQGMLDAILKWYELQVTGNIGRSLAKIQ